MRLVSNIDKTPSHIIVYIPKYNYSYMIVRITLYKYNYNC